MAFELRLAEYAVAGQKFLLFAPDEEAIAASYQKGEIAFPYWSKVWPAALCLAAFILQYPQYVAGKKTLELASGLGLPSLVAALSGAAVVTTSDYVPDAVAAVQQTFSYHQLIHTTTQLIDWTALPNDLTTEVLLLSDVSYDETLFAIQQKVVLSLIEKGCTVLISTPQRLIAKQAIEPLLPWCTGQHEMEIVHQQQATAISLFVLQPPKAIEPFFGSFL